MNLQHLNGLPQGDATAVFMDCCASPAWAGAMVEARPFADRTSLLDAATAVWAETSEAEWLTAFAAHPRIGDMAALKRKFAGHTGLEQGQVAAADTELLERLHRGNEDYAAKFGFIFIICASGQSPAAMLAALETRLEHTRERELSIAHGEQGKILHLRLERLLDGGL